MDSLIDKIWLDRIPIMVEQGDTRAVSVHGMRRSCFLCLLMPRCSVHQLHQIAYQLSRKWPIGYCKNQLLIGKLSVLLYGHPAGSVIRLANFCKCCICKSSSDHGTFEHICTNKTCPKCLWCIFSMNCPLSTIRSSCCIWNTCPLTLNLPTLQVQGEGAWGTICVTRLFTSSYSRKHLDSTRVIGELQLRILQSITGFKRLKKKNRNCSEDNKIGSNSTASFLRMMKLCAFFLVGGPLIEYQLYEANHEPYWKHPIGLVMPSV